MTDWSLLRIISSNLEESYVRSFVYRVLFDVILLRFIIINIKAQY